MRRTNFILLAICIFISSCSSSEDEPIINQPGDKASDWTVIYTEYCYSNPQWINHKNTTEECENWKAQHKPNLTIHTSSGSLDEEIWTWEVNYHAKSESDMINELKDFVTFTTLVKAGPEDKNRYGSDVFEATLINSAKTRYVTYRHKSPLFWFDSSYCRYRVEYHESRLVQDGEKLQEPPLLEQWARNHELTYQNQTNNGRSRVWVEDLNSLTMSDIHTLIDPFINWSIGDANAKSFHRLMVRVHDYQEDITAWYSTVP